MLERLRGIAAVVSVLSLLAASPAAAHMLHAAAEAAGIPYLHAHGSVVHSHKHDDGHHKADKFAASAVGASAQAAASAALEPPAGPALDVPDAISALRLPAAAAAPAPLRRSPPGARAPPASSSAAPTSA